MSPTVLTAQPFEASIFGGPVFRLSVRDFGLSTDDVVAALSTCRRSSEPKLVACRVNASAKGAIAALQEAGFRHVETLVTFEGPLSSADKGLEPEDFGRMEDADDLYEIGRTAFHYDRFHADRRIGSAVADKIKAEWVLNNLRGRANANLVVREAGRAMGFAQCLFQGSTVVVDLIATAPHAAGRGLGSTLMRKAQCHYRGRAALIRAGTQETNSASGALYRRCGMAPVAHAETWHWIP